MLVGKKNAGTYFILKGVAFAHKKAQSVLREMSTAPETTVVPVRPALYLHFPISLV